MLSTRDPLQIQGHIHAGRKDISCKQNFFKSRGRNTYIRQNYFKTKPIIRDKEAYLTKISIQQKDITFVNIHASNAGAPKYIKQILIDIKRKIGSNIAIKSGL